MQRVPCPASDDPRIVINVQAHSGLAPGPERRQGKIIIDAAIGENYAALRGYAPFREGHHLIECGQGDRIGGRGGDRLADLDAFERRRAKLPGTNRIRCEIEGW